MPGRRAPGEDPGPPAAGDGSPSPLRREGVRLPERADRAGEDGTGHQGGSPCWTTRHSTEVPGGEGLSRPVPIRAAGPLSPTEARRTRGGRKRDRWQFPDAAPRGTSACRSRRPRSRRRPPPGRERGSGGSQERSSCGRLPVPRDTFAALPDDPGTMRRIRRRRLEDVTPPSRQGPRTARRPGPRPSGSRPCASAHGSAGAGASDRASRASTSRIGGRS